MKKAVILIGLVVMMSTPASAAQNTLTHGMIQRTLRIGITDQASVIEAFGAPNLTTIDGAGQEVWVYDRQSTVNSSTGGNLSFGGMLFGMVGTAVGSANTSNGLSASKTEQSQRTTTLIIKFGPDKLVRDFRSRSSAF